MREFFKFRCIPQDLSSHSEVENDQISLLNLSKDLLIRSIPTKLYHFNLIADDIEEWNPTVQIRCGICWGTINEMVDELARCPYCERAFHKSHWLDWMTKKSYCPTCRKSIQRAR